jgi:DNA-binding transcriptional regulator YiaG
MPRRRPARLTALEEARLRLRVRRRVEDGSAVRIRQAAGLGAGKVARQLGVTLRTLRDWETGRYEPRDPAKAALWMAVLDQLAAAVASEQAIPPEGGEDEDGPAPTGTEGGRGAAP